MDHPQVGEMRLWMSKPDAGGSDGVEVIVYHAEPGTADAERVALLTSLVAEPAERPHTSVNAGLQRPPGSNEVLRSVPDLELVVLLEGVLAPMPVSVPFTTRQGLPVILGISRPGGVQCESEWACPPPSPRPM